MTLTVPTVELAEVFHVGTLNPADKGSRSPSWEGSGLSVSQHPDAWVEIARLGGLPTWNLTRAGDAGVFVDWHEIPDALAAEAREWAEAEGLVFAVDGFRVTWWDDEWGEDVCSIVPASQVGEYRDENDELGEDRYRIEPEPLWVGTHALTERLGFAATPGDALDQATIVFFDEQFPDFDGIWWADDLAPERLSAPRGVIFARAVELWQPAQVGS